MDDGVTASGFGDYPFTGVPLGEPFDLDEFGGRLLSGSLPLITYGLLGGLLQSYQALSHGQLPLAFGFTLETPWSGPPILYRAGEPGLPILETEAYFAGQRVLGPIRTHTTGLIDAGIRLGASHEQALDALPAEHLYGTALRVISEAADDLVHPTRSKLLARERIQPNSRSNVESSPRSDASTPMYSGFGSNQFSSAVFSRCTIGDSNGSQDFGKSCSSGAISRVRGRTRTE